MPDDPLIRALRELEGEMRDRAWQDFNVTYRVHDLLLGWADRLAALLRRTGSEPPLHPLDVEARVYSNVLERADDVLLRMRTETFAECSFAEEVEAVLRRLVKLMRSADAVASSGS